MKIKLQKIINILKDNDQTISFAESCTGGRVAAAFTSIAGVSSVFDGSFVTYSNEIKHKWLGVSTQTLEKYGAVSSECVSEMLVGIQGKSSSDYAIAISGIAGPGGGTELKPIGTVYIGIISPVDEIVLKFQFMGDRETIQRLATEEAINLFEEILTK